MESAGGVYKATPLGIKHKPLCISIRAGAKEEYFVD
jgi:hypothetical protein